jgi:hypothetical protein
VRTVAEPLLAPDAVAGFTNLYRRQDDECGGQSWEALTTLGPPHKGAALEMAGASDDGSAAIYAMWDNLPGTEAPDLGGHSSALYYKEDGGPPRYVCFLPSGAPSGGGCVAGTNNGDFANARGNTHENAISADGSRVFWTDKTQGPGRIYLRSNPGQPESARQFGAATGSGDLLGPAFGTGNLIQGSPTVNGVFVASGAFVVGQTITGEGIAAGTTIVECTPSCEAPTKLKLSTPAVKGAKSGAELTGEASSLVANVVTKTGAFAAGQEISGPGIAAGTTVEAVEGTTLTLSAPATKTSVGAALEATSECLEAAKACTTVVSKEAEKLSGASAARYWTAAGDGSAVIFSADSDLYRFDVDTATTTKIAGKVAGVMGASQDASRIYFASQEVLSGANAQGKAPAAGEPNLYLYEGGSYELVATLTANEVHPGYRFAAINPQPRWRSSRVSPDGLHAAFMSAGQPTGYDNTDARNGEADAEVYLYEASAEGGAGDLICASCNPTGARPVGQDIYYPAGNGTNHIWAAAHMPVWSDHLYAPRVLAADGSRLYFESSDALSPRDTNGAQDVYQWEAPGAGGCDQGDPDYFELNQGCLRLISSGQSPRAAEFVDASPSGDDVFFATLSSLLPQDYALVDVYDARVDGGFPQPPPAAPQCEGEACQSPPEAPNDPTPASAAFEGAGNVAGEPAAQAPKRCAKGKVRRKGRCVIRHPKKAHRRAKHERRAGR